MRIILSPACGLRNCQSYTPGFINEFGCVGNDPHLTLSSTLRLERRTKGGELGIVSVRASSPMVAIRRPFNPSTGSLRVERDHGAPSTMRLLDLAPPFCSLTFLWLALPSRSKPNVSGWPIWRMPCICPGGQDLGYEMILWIPLRTKERLSKKKFFKLLATCPQAAVWSRVTPCCLTDIGGGGGPLEYGINIVYLLGRDNRLNCYALSAWWAHAYV